MISKRISSGAWKKEKKGRENEKMMRELLVNLGEKSVNLPQGILSRLFS